MKRMIAVIIALTAFASSAQPDLHALGYTKRAKDTLTADQDVKLDIQGKAAGFMLEHALVLGKPVLDWKAESRRAREVGDRLPDRVTVAVLEINYIDGRTVSFNIRYGETVGDVTRDWWNPVDGFIYHLAFAQVAWTAPLEQNGLRHAAAYRAALPNPRPDIAVRSASLKAAEGLGNGKLLVFGHGTYGTIETNRDVYFVAPDGNDDGPGTFEQPWATLHQAADTIEAGDTVYVRGGIYMPEKRVAFKHLDAPEGRRTSIIGWPGETATFDCINAFWDMSPERKLLGFEVFPVNQSMIMAYDCDRFTLKNLHIIRSRCRGFGMDSSYWKHPATPKHLIDGGRPEKVTEEPFADSEIVYCSVYKTMDAGIRFCRAKNGRLIGNTLIRPQCIGMGHAEKETAGHGPLAGMEATTFINHLGERKRNPPMEGIDCGRLFDTVIAYNEIGWGDKECCLIDGDVDGLRVHHNYVHNAWNMPWVMGIGPNGYGKQQHIEIDHNIAHHTGKGFGIGTEGGGFGRNVRIHHNLTWDCHWGAHGVTGAWGDGNADLFDISIYNNTAFHHGHYTNNPRIPWKENTGPAGGITVSFARGYGKKGKEISGTVEDVVIANNLILQPRDFALALVNEGDPEAARIRFIDNMTDMPKDNEELMNRLHGWRKDQRWRAVRDEHLITYDAPIVRNPSARDFRLRPETPATDGGTAIDEHGKPIAGEKTYIGAFGKDSKWVEIDAE